jgi:3',5'-nucleoside bisphosphate phosphatase
MMRADLHLHTYYSDGTESPQQVVERAAQLNFDIVAITDHDTVAGVPEALEAGGRLGVRVIPGVEITAQYRHHELHLLAYFDSDIPENESWRNPELIKLLEEFSRRRAERAVRIVQKLNDLGIGIKVEDVERAAALGEKEGEAKTALGRPHVAAAMVAGGHVTSLDEAFSRYLKKGKPAWVDKERAEARDVIEVVHKSMGIMALAHPGFLKDENIPEKLVKDKIDAIEVYHSRHTPSQSTRFGHWAREHSLIVTGGSDCHGMLKGEPLMGKVELKGEELENFLRKVQSHEKSSR